MDLQYAEGAINSFKKRSHHLLKFGLCGNTNVPKDKA